MTISQHRVIALINTAIDYKQAFDRLAALIDEEYAATQVSSADGKEQHTNPESAIKAIRIIYLAAGTKMLIEPTKSPVILEKEYNHFRANAKRNDRTRIKAEQKRRNQGIKPRNQDGLANNMFLSEPSRPQRQIVGPSLSEPTTPIDLSYDPDDPENALDQGAGLRPSIFTDEERATQERMIKETLAQEQLDRINKTLIRPAPSDEGEEK